MTASHLQRFAESDFCYWIDRLAGSFDVRGPAGNHLIERRSVELTMPVGLYVGVDAFDTCLYVGKVQRRDAGVASRLRSHAQPVQDWDSVWLIPLIEGCRPELVLTFEAAMIRRHRPLSNIQHNRLRCPG